MTQARKFLFDNDFARPEKMAKEKAVYTEEQMTALRTEAYQAGRSEMAAEQKASEEQHVAELVAALSARVETLIAETQAAEDRAVQDAGALAVAVCRKVMPTLAEQNALTEIEGLIRRAITEMHEEPRLVIRVADGKLDQLQERFERLSNAFTGKLVLFGDDELASTDCAVLWADGGAERDFSRLWGEIETALSGLTDARTQPQALSPLEGLTDGIEAHHTETSGFADAAPEERDFATATAKQESGHG